ncbi:MAG TPA: thioredoxin-dependent thiol peroxidase [Bacteroidales bacterium]|nr:thioredoxin-dependent thiol peroxidase [Bacteroidales bacterium]
MGYLRKGAKAPSFKGIDQDGRTIRLEDFKGKKVILYFYPKDDTPGCAAEACNLRDNYNVWLQRGFEVIGISPDNEKSHKRFREKYNLPFSLLADPGKKILKAYGAWGAKQMYGKSYDGVLRTTYVINEEGMIDEVFAKVDTKNHTSQILQELKLE